MTVLKQLNHLLVRLRNKLMSALYRLGLYNLYWVLRSLRDVELGSDNISLPHRLELVKLLNRHNRDVKILLEVGCGNGSNLIIAERILNCRCIGIDLAPSAIKFCKQRTIGREDTFQFLNLSANSVKFKKLISELDDYIILTDASLMYLDESQIAAFFNEITNSRIRAILCVELHKNNKGMKANDGYYHDYSMIMSKFGFQVKENLYFSDLGLHRSANWQEYGRLIYAEYK